MQPNAQELFEILARENAGMLIAYVRASIRDTATADDVFQETMLTAWKKLEDYDKHRPFGPWLRGIAANLIMAHFRKSAARGPTCKAATLEYLSARFDEVANLEGDTFDEKMDALRACLEQLPDSYGDPIQLRYQEDLAYAEIAHRLELAVETVKKRLQRAKSRLLDCMERKIRAGESQ